MLRFVMLSVKGKYVLFSIWKYMYPQGQAKSVCFPGNSLLSGKWMLSRGLYLPDLHFYSDLTELINWIRAEVIYSIFKPRWLRNCSPFFFPSIFPTLCKLDWDGDGDFGKFMESSRDKRRLVPTFLFTGKPTHQLK